MDISHFGKFCVVSPEGEAYMEYEIVGNTLTVLHTKVPEALGGRGIAGKLAEETAAFAGAHHFTLASECSYMTGWLQKQSRV